MTKAITSVKINDFLVFMGEFATDFCPGVNVLIGGNGTGKTTLMKSIYNVVSMYRGCNNPVHPKTGDRLFDKFPALLTNNPIAGNDVTSITITVCNKIANWIYIPEKDILEHAKGLLTFIEQKQTGFGPIYKDVLVAMDVPTRLQTSTQKSIGEKIGRLIGGVVAWDKGDGSFYTMRTDGTRIPFANEASGFKKLGYIGLLVASGQLDSSSVLLWDEPENSLNPELMPVIVDILLELQRSGTQIFIATHSEMLASYFAAIRNSNDEVLFYSLHKDAEGIVRVASDKRFELLEPNPLTKATVDLYELELERGLGGND